MDLDETLAALTREGDRRNAIQNDLAATEQRIHQLAHAAHGLGVSIAEIARRTGYHRNSLRAILDEQS